MQKQTFLTKFEKREFFLSFVEGSQPSGFSTAIITLDKVVDDNSFEYIYALNEWHVEQMILLKVGESLYFQPIRDDKDSKGIILRKK